MRTTEEYLAEASDFDLKDEEGALLFERRDMFFREEAIAAINAAISDARAQGRAEGLEEIRRMRWALELLASPMANSAWSSEERQKIARDALIDKPAPARAKALPPELIALSEKATQGPWIEGEGSGSVYHARDEPSVCVVVGANRPHGQFLANRAFIVACVNYVRALIDKPAEEQPHDQ